MPGIYGDVNLSAMGNEPAESVQRPESEKGPANAGPSALMDFTGKGPLLEESDDKAVFKAIDKIVEKQEPLAKNRAAAAKHRKRIRSGVPFSVLNKDEDRNVWTAELPPGGSDQPSPVPNKADDLCRKIVSQVIVDLPQPDPKPATDGEQDRAAADLAKRFLKVDGDESGTNDPELFRDALDTSQTDASAFAHVWTDPQGDGWRPLRIKAHPQAVDANNPLVGLDPVTQQEVPTADYVLRYVTDAGQFTENAAEAAMQWMPKIKRDMLGQAHVRTVPETADVHRAEAVVLLMCGPVSELKRRVPEMAQWGDGELSALTEWKPRRAKVLVPTALKSRFKEQQNQKGNADVGDDTLVFWYHKYCRVSRDYPDGAEIIISGADGGLVLKKATLRADLPGEDDGETTIVLRDIPVSQCKSLHDSETRDPFGKCPIDLFGATNEGLAQLYGAVLEDTDKRLHPNFVTTVNSPIQAWQWNQRTGEGLTVVSKDDMPMYEEFADLASFTPQVIQSLEKAMETAAMLGSAAQNLNTTDAESGTAKSIELTQAKTNLAPVAQNFFAFVKRYWRLKLEAAQASLTIPQQVEYAGVDQSYKQRWFSGADFVGVKDVAIQAGTGTLMGAADKQNYLIAAQNQQWLDPDEAAMVGRSTVADDLGVSSSPFEDTIKRELAQWMDGPPEPKASADPMQPPAPTWAETYNAHAQEQQAWQQQTAAAQQQGADPSTVPQPQAPAPWTPFVARPTDDDPSVAMKQYKVLRDFVASSDYMKHPPEWRAMLDQRLLLARQAAGIQTMAEQAAAAQQQAQMQSEEKDKDRAFKKGEGDANRAAKAQGSLAA